MSGKKHNDGGPAFPRARKGHDGMTLRDYFAGQALALYKMGNCVECEEEECKDHEVIALHCYELADAMLEERDK